MRRPFAGLAPRGLVPAGLTLAGLALGILSGLGCHRGTETAAPAQPEKRDVVLAEGIELPSAAELARIRALLPAAQALTPAGVTVDYPPAGAIFPPDIAAPTLLWHDATTADRWLIDIAASGSAQHLTALVPGDPPAQGEIDKRCISERNEIYQPTPYQAMARSWRPDRTTWEAMKRLSADRPARLTVYGFRGAEPERPLSRGEVALMMSRDPVGAPIFYRDVPLMPSQTEEGVIKPLAKGALPLINWRLRDIGRDESRILLQDMPTCANCHSFSADGKTLGLDVDGPQGDKGAYAIVPVARRTVIRDQDVMTWNAYPGMKTGLNTLGFLSRVSPDGQHVLSTINEALYVRNFWNYKFNQVFYPTRGILAWYERSSGKIQSLPGADDPRYVHCDPVWSPDGRTIVFARATARDPYIAGRPEATYANDPNETPIQYDLYRIPWNDGRGGKAEPLQGAGGNGMSNSFPKISPDGRWVVFVQSRNGQLMRPDGRLFIVPLEGGQARPMRCNLTLMNSWHSFSPSGRWMVFSSKSNTPYTQMFLTHLDDAGNDSPPILIENSTAANRAVNIPEFVNVPYDDFQGIDVPAVEASRHFVHGSDLAAQGKNEEAVAEYEKALAGPLPEWRTSAWKVHGNLSKALLLLGRREPALQHIHEALRLNPYSAEMHANLGYLLFGDGKIDEALAETNLALKYAPKDPKPWTNRATIRLKQGDKAGARSDYDTAIGLDARCVDAYVGRGMLRRDDGDRAGALADFTGAIAADPKAVAALYNRAVLLMKGGDPPGALRDLTDALQMAPADWPHRAEAEGLRRQIRDRMGAAR